MNKNDFNTFFVVMIGLFLFCFVSYFVFSVFIGDEEEVSGFIVVDCNRFFQYTNGNYKDLKSLDNMEENEFRVYSNNVYINDYFVSYNNNTYYFFDKEYQSYQILEPFLAISKDSKLDLVDFSSSSFIDDDYNTIRSYLRSIKINYDGEYSTYEKYVTDLDNDGYDDYIYILGNQLYSNDVFYVIFARVDSKNVTISKQIGDSIENYELGWILNVEKDGLNDILLKKSIVERFNYYLYRYDKKKGYSKSL